MQTGRLAIIGGHSILGSQYAADGRRVGVALDCGTHVVVQRHGLDHYTPAHLVRHADNLAAVAALGCDRVLALSSVGGLRRDVGVGTFLAPDDFIALHTSVSSFDDARGHRVPGFDRPVEGARRRRVGRVDPPRGAPRRWRLLADVRAALRDARPRSATSRSSPTSWA